MILVYLTTLCFVFGLSLSATEYVFGDTSPQDEAIKEAEECDSWIHIRNVSIYDDTTDGLQRDMFVLVTCTYIHKIGRTPLFILDKDITFNVNGEGRILLPIPIGEQQSERSEKSSPIKEEDPANLLIVDAESLEDVKKISENPAFQNNQNVQEIEEVRLLMINGEIIKNTLPRTRVGSVGLRKFKK